MSLWRSLTPPIQETFLIRGTRLLDVVTVAGPDAATYLHGQLSANITGLGVGDMAHSLLLQPQGKMVAWCRVVRTGDESFAIVVDRGAGSAVVERLERFKLRTRCEITTEEVEAIAVRASEDGVELGESVVDDGRLRFVPLGWSTLAGADVLDPTAIEGLSITTAEHLIEPLRIAAGIPAHGSEITERTIPAELPVINMSTDFTKGCYVGQELVARMDSRGNNAPRQIRVVIGSGEKPKVGAPVAEPEGEIGVLTSVAAVSDGWVALASIKRAGLDTTAAVVSGQKVEMA
ncbi:MAG: folate-binding protein YgfZ [Acidimicrobiales bacterium]|nr:folate-binding protein YgfZ [Acidimicrobiales bacterium]